MTTRIVLRSFICVCGGFTRPRSLSLAEAGIGSPAWFRDWFRGAACLLELQFFRACRASRCLLLESHPGRHLEFRASRCRLKEQDVTDNYALPHVSRH